MKSQKERARVFHHCIESRLKEDDKGWGTSFLHRQEKRLCKKERKRKEKSFFQFTNLRSGRSKWLLLRQWNVDQSNIKWEKRIFKKVNIFIKLSIITKVYETKEIT